MKLQIEDRVNHSYLGNGIILEFITGITWVRVLWDIDPPEKYRCGDNPSSEHVDSLRRI